jgi:hypothetical protein
MALPQLQLPESLPPFKAGTLEIQPPDLYGQVLRSGGNSRRRRLYRTAPTLVSVQLEVTQAQLEEFYTWFEGPLAAGSEPFAARIAKIGPGVEWFRAFIIGSYTAEHLEGEGSHVISFRMRLEDGPEEVAPDNPDMLSEVTVALEAVFSEGAPQNLLSAVFCALQATFDTGPLLVSEILVSLQTEHGGPVGQELRSEVYCNLQFDSVVLAADTFSSEAEVSLLSEYRILVELSSEVLCALDFLSEFVPGFNDPSGTFAVSNYAGFSPGGSSSATVRAESDGQYLGRQGTGGYYNLEDWWTITQPGIGAGKWVRATCGTPLSLTGAASNVWLSLDLGREWKVARTTTGATSVSLTIEIATDPDGVHVVSSYGGTLEAEYNT